MDLVMTFVIKVGEADAQLSELLTKVEAGDEVVIERAGQPVARITRIAPQPRDAADVVAEIKAARAGYKPTTMQELVAWKHEGRREFDVDRD
jgi:prevent-host-death family protein